MTVPSLTRRVPVVGRVLADRYDAEAARAVVEIECCYRAAVNSAEIGQSYIVSNSTILEQDEPAVAMTADDATDRGWCHRGVEPMRIVIMPQRDQRATILAVIEPMSVQTGGRALRPQRPGLTTDIGRWLHRSDLFTNPPR
jgi:hypothetical protein